MLVARPQTQRVSYLPGKKGPSAVIQHDAFTSRVPVGKKIKKRTLVHREGGYRTRVRRCPSTNHNNDDEKTVAATAVTTPDLADGKLVDPGCDDDHDEVEATRLCLVVSIFTSI